MPASAKPCRHRTVLPVNSITGEHAITWDPEREVEFHTDAWCQYCGCLRVYEYNGDTSWLRPTNQERDQ